MFEAEEGDHGDGVSSSSCHETADSFAHRSYADQLIGRKHKKLVAGHVAAEGKETLGMKSLNAVTDQHQHRRGLLRSRDLLLVSEPCQSLWGWA